MFAMTRPMTSQGSPYSRFQRALRTNNLNLIRSAAAELPRIELKDALAICLAIRAADPERFEPAALRWLGRFATERRDATLADGRAAVRALQDLRVDPERAVAALRRLCA